MTSVATGTQKGTIAEVVGINSLNFDIDDPNGTYIAVLVPHGSIKVMFTAHAQADATVRTEGVKLKATVTLTGEQTQYNGISIFTVATNNFFVLNNGEKVKPGEANAVTITAQEIANCLVFAEGIVLDDYSEFQAFETAMKT